MNRRRQPRWVPWQTSLRTLLVVAIAAGTLAGLVGPAIMQAVREYPNPPAPPPIRVPADVRLDEDASNGYFESAETPLY